MMRWGNTVFDSVWIGLCVAALWGAPLQAARFEAVAEGEQGVVQAFRFSFVEVTVSLDFALDVLELGFELLL